MLFIQSGHDLTLSYSANGNMATNNAHHRIVASLLPACLRLYSSFDKLSSVVADSSAVNTSFVHAGSFVNHKVNLLQVYFAPFGLVIAVGRMVRWLGYLV